MVPQPAETTTEPIVACWSQDQQGQKICSIFILHNYMRGKLNSSD